MNQEKNNSKFKIQNSKLDDIAIKVSNLNKIYHLYDKPQDRLKEALNPFKKKYHHDFYALSDVSFEIKKGETIGIIGKNGAGKSTLLKIITGVLTPSSGHVHVNGRIASLLELGAGFNPEYTGVENIYLQGTLMGYSHEEMESKIDAILEFADIGEFIHQQVKTYSSGMFARLAFAVAINVEPDILIVDEALSVGDMRFQQKCIRKMSNFCENGKTVLFVTHDIGIINKFCSKAIWLDFGKVLDFDFADKVTKKYFLSSKYIEKKDNKNNKNVLKETSNSKIKWINVEHLDSFGSKKVLISDVSLFSKDNKVFTNTFLPNENLIFFLNLKILNNIENPIVGFIVRDSLGMDITGMNSVIYEFKETIEFETEKNKIIKFNFELPYLKAGKYSISPAIADGTEIDHEQLHWINDAIFFDVISSNQYKDIGWYFGLNNASIGEDKND